jgi:hypothetical protein
VGRDGEQLGPYDLDTVRRMIQSGQLDPADHAYPPDGRGWVPLSDLPELHPVAAASVPVPVPVPETAPAVTAAPPPDTADDPETWVDHVRLHVLRAFAWNVRTVAVTASERAALSRAGVEVDLLQRYLAWRRSLFLFLIGPTALSALLAVIGFFALDFSTLSVLGILVQLVVTASLVVLPLAAFHASRVWTDPRTSRQRVLWAWAASFALPLLVALLPVTWLLDLDAGNEQVMALARILGGFAYFVSLLPLVLSIMPGVLRVCIRVKALLPESIVPGWFVMAAAPFSALLLLVAFVLVHQLAGNVLLIVGLLGLMAAPLLFVWNARLFVRPLVTDKERRRFARVQVHYAVVVGAAAAALLAFFLTAEIGPAPLVGAEGEAAVTYGRFFWQVFRFLTEFAGRSLFITAVAVDFFVLMNHSVWENLKALARTEQGQGYDLTMERIGEVLGSRRKG